MVTLNRQITLAARPVGMPKESDFRMIESPVPSPGDGEVLLRSLYLSVDPYMRGRMNEARGYADPVALGAVMIGGAVGEVVESRSGTFAPGDIAVGVLGWQDFAVLPARELRKVNPALAPITTALGILGMPGLTAYFGLLDVGSPKPGETVVVSGAAGAVGSLVGQIAKIQGCRAIGIAGGEKKCAYLTGELGFDGSLDYKGAVDYHAGLKALCPDGVDVYFDNTGGAISDAVFRLLNTRARVAVCGQISQYNLEKPELGPRWLSQILTRQARVEGFLVMQFAAKYGEGIRQMAAWLREGKLKYAEDIAVGLENAPAAFIGLLQGRNTGKQLVRTGAAA
jgi:NADPH-dependent curcumin reductase CurA